MIPGVDPLPPFIHGCNYPWSTDGTTVFYGLDFGANVWGSHLGVSTRRAAVSRDFETMASLGFTAARWFVFCDGRAGIRFDDAGTPVGLDPHVFVDLDAALEIAGAVGISLVLVLLDHRWMFRGLADSMVDAATGALLQTSLPAGRAHVLVERQAADHLFRHVIAPVVRRYSPNGDRADLSRSVCAYELLNEPDFIIEEWEQDLSTQVVLPVSFETFGNHVSRLSEIVHRESTARVTLAAARLRNLWAWDDPGLGLDFLQVHSYPDLNHPERDEDIFGQDASSLRCAHPIVLGEFPGDGPGRHPAGAAPPSWTLENYLDFALSSGYRGAWPWSFSGTDAYGRLPERALRRFAQDHPSVANVRAFT